MLAKCPLPAIAVAFACGILLADRAAGWLWACVALLPLAGWLYAPGYRRRRLVGPLLAAFTLLGAARFWTVTLVPRNDISRIAPAAITVTGIVASDLKAVRPAQSAQGGMAGSCRFAIERREAENDEGGALGSQPLTGVVELHLPLGPSGAGPSQSHLQIGDVLTVRGTLEAPAGQRNPGGFDYRVWLGRQGIRTLLSVRRRADWHTVGHDADVALRLISPLRQGLLAHCRAAFSPDHAGTLEGLLIGSRADLPAALDAEFRRTGASHLLATAGLHVGFVAALLLTLWRFARVPRRAALLLTIGALILYAEVASGRASVVRAVIVAGIVLMGMALEREPHPPNSLALAALCLLLYEPRNLSEPGFQLSFATLITIVLLMPLVHEPLRRITARRQGGARETAGSRLVKRAVQVVVAIGCLTCAAQIGSAPLVACYENALSPVALLANMLVVPVAPALLACGFGGAVCGSIAPRLAWPFDTGANWLLGYAIGVVHGCAGFPWAGASVVAPASPFIAGYYAVAWGLALWLRWRLAVHGRNGGGLTSQPDAPPDGDEGSELQASDSALTASARSLRDPIGRFAAGYGPIWLLLALLIAGHLALYGWSRFQSRPDGALYVTFLDVGQGDAAVLKTPGGRVIVVDTGGIGSAEGEDEGRRVVEPYLRSIGCDRIDALILTHPHADHIGGATTLLADFAVGLLLDNGQDSAEPEALRALETAQRRRVDHRTMVRGQTLDTPDGVTIQALGPTVAETAGKENNASMVLLVRYGRTAFLLTGDAEAGEEADMLRDGQPVACDVLKAGHHGSRTSTTPEFLNAAHPRWAIVSVGAHNLYGHPDPEVLSRLASAGAIVYRTDRNGAVTCLSDGVTVQVTPLRRAP